MTKYIIDSLLTMSYDCLFRHRHSQASSTSSSSSSATVMISPSTAKVVETKMTCTSANIHVCIESVRQSTLIYFFIYMLMNKSRFLLNEKQRMKVLRNRGSKKKKRRGMMMQLREIISYD